MLRLSVCLSVTLCIVAKRCVLEQNLLLRAYRNSYIWEIDWYQNEWPWPLFRGRMKVVQSLHYISRWISRKPLEIEVWFQRTTNRKWLSNGRMTDNVTWPQNVLWGSMVGYPNDSLAFCTRHKTGLLSRARITSRSSCHLVDLNNYLGWLHFFSALTRRLRRVKKWQHWSLYL